VGIPLNTDCFIHFGAIGGVLCGANRAYSDVQEKHWALEGEYSIKKQHGRLRRKKG
jgi:hypothetical protein